MEGFRQSILNKKKEGVVPVIVDFKCISPGEGHLIDEEDAVHLARMIQEAGAPAISVVTEPENFGGSLNMLEKITGTVDIPVLRKDFIRTKEEIEISIGCGASAVLLMCSVMDEETMRMCYSYALECGIEPLVETHNMEEMSLALELGAKLMGINNRNILELEKDGGTIDTTEAVMRQLSDAGMTGEADEKTDGADKASEDDQAALTGISEDGSAALNGASENNSAAADNSEPDNRVLISESGILTPDDVRRAVSSGADAVLVGTAIWKAENPVSFLKQMMRPEGFIL